MARYRIILIVGFIGFAFFRSASPVVACGGGGSYLTWRFWYEAQPSTGDEAFVKGKLGIIGPSMPASRLWVAYRHLAGIGVSDQQQEDVLGALDRSGRFSQGDLYNIGAAVSSWLEARSHVPGVDEIERPGYLRNRVVSIGDRQVRNILRNCLSDSFHVAVKTLDERTLRFGVGSPEVIEWVRGQDKVYMNCDDGSTLPLELDSSWHQVLRFDREYQMASALYYSEKYAEAEQAFRQIASRRESQWWETARYMAGRTMARDGRLEEAVKWLDTAAADASSEDWVRRSHQLADHYLARHDPQARLIEVDLALSREELGRDFKQDLTDWIMCLEKVRRERQPPSTGELTTWFWLWRRWSGWDFNGPDPTSSMADRPWLLARLQRTYGRTLGWLDQDLSEAETLIELASGIKEDEPGYLTAQYHRARLLIDMYRISQARDELGRLVATEGLSLADENRLRDLRSLTANTVSDFLIDTVLRPVEVGYSNGERRSLSPVSERTWKPDARLPTQRAIDFFNRLSPRDLVELVETAELPQGLKVRLAHTSWTRAVVLEQFEVARQASALAAELGSYLKNPLRISADDAAASFDAAITMLRYPQLSPLFLSVIDQDRSPYSYSTASKRLTSRMPVAPIVAELSDEESIGAMVRGVEIGLTVLELAEQHRDDPRVPEALHRLVQSKRASGDISQAAFQLLHRRYADSPWAEKTPYWYK
jgi:hypothetical protein